MGPLIWYYWGKIKDDRGSKTSWFYMGTKITEPRGHPGYQYGRAASWHDQIVKMRTKPNVVPMLRALYDHGRGEYIDLFYLRW